MPGFTLTNGDDTWPAGVDSSGNDTVNALAGADSIDGGAGDDAVYGGQDRDTLRGGTGDDWLDAGPQPLHDVLDGGAGNDTAVLALEGVVNLATGNSIGVFAAASTKSFTLYIDGTSGPTLSSIENFRITSGDEADGISGAEGNDTLTSGGGNDRISGGAGDDIIAKTWGTYALDGGVGQDTLIVSNTDRG